MIFLVKIEKLEVFDQTIKIYNGDIYIVALI